MSDKTLKTTIQFRRDTTENWVTNKGVESGANANLIEIVKANGVALNIAEKAVNIPLAGEAAGLVVSSDAENKVAVGADGTMEVNSVNINKLVQAEGDTLILDGGTASV